MVVETETAQDWAKDVDTETLSRVSLISGSYSMKYYLCLAITLERVVCRAPLHGCIRNPEQVQLEV